MQSWGWDGGSYVWAEGASLSPGVEGAHPQC